MSIFQWFEERRKFKERVLIEVDEILLSKYLNIHPRWEFLSNNAKNQIRHDMHQAWGETGAKIAEATFPKVNAILESFHRHHLYFWNEDDYKSYLQDIGVYDRREERKLANLSVGSDDFEAELFGEQTAEPEDDTEPIDRTYKNMEFRNNKRMDISKETINQWFALESGEAITDSPLWSFAQEFTSPDGKTIVQPDGNRAKVKTRIEKVVDWNYAHGAENLFEREIQEYYFDNLMAPYNNRIHDKKIMGTHPDQLVMNHEVWTLLHKETSTTYFNPVIDMTMQLNNSELLRFMIWLRMPQFKQRVLDEERRKKQVELEEKKRIGNLKYSIMEKYEDRVRNGIVTSIDEDTTQAKALAERIKQDEQILDELMVKIQSKQFDKSDYFEIVDKKLKKENV